MDLAVIPSGPWNLSSRLWKRGISCHLILEMTGSLGFSTNR